MKYKEQLEQELKQAELRLQIAEDLEKKKNETASTVEQPVTENSDGEAGSESNNTNQSGVATNDNDI